MFILCHLQGLDLDIMEDFNVKEVEANMVAVHGTSTHLTVLR